MRDFPKKFLLFVAGAGLLVLGIVLVLVWWPQVVTLFRGVAGMSLAVIGMLILFLNRE